jgi:hypothetical protein
LLLGVEELADGRTVDQWHMSTPAPSPSLKTAPSP